MSVDKIISTVIEGLEDEDDLKDVALTGALDDKDIKYWSHYMRSWRFNTEEEARQRIFDNLQHHDKSPGPFEPWGESKNRWFSQAMPVYQDRFGKWRVGAPLMTWVKAKRQDANARRRAREEAEEKAREAQFHRNYPGFPYPGKGYKGYEPKPSARTGLGKFDESFHSDFSDGTNGEPSAAAPFTGGQGEQAGLPDYKYLERQQKWAKRLKALRARRDPDGIEKPIGEGEEDDLDIKELSGPDIHYEKTEGMWPETHRVSVTYSDAQYPHGDYHLGSVWWHAAHPGSKNPKVGVLKKLDEEFPWTAQAVSHLYHGSARFKTMHEAGNWLFNVRFKHPSKEPLEAFVNRWNELSTQAKRGRMLEALEDDYDDDLKDVSLSTPFVDLFEFVHAYKAIPLPVVGRNLFHKYFFGTNRQDENMLHELRNKHKFDYDHVWTVYSFAARPAEVYIAPGMKQPGGAWAMDHVFGWFLTEVPSGSTVFRMDPRDVRDNNVYLLK